MYVLGIGGTTNPASESERILRLALAEAERLGAVTRAFTARDLDFPLFEEHVARPANVLAFLREIERCDGVLVVSPSYHGSLSGRIKNAFDYLQDVNSGPRPLLDGRVMGCIAVGAGHIGAITTVDALRAIAHALRAWPAPMSLGVSTRDPFTEKVTDRLNIVVRQVVGGAPVTQ